MASRLTSPAERSSEHPAAILTVACCDTFMNCRNDSSEKAPPERTAEPVFDRSRQVHPGRQGDVLLARLVIVPLVHHTRRCLPASGNGTRLARGTITKHTKGCSNARRLEFVSFVFFVVHPSSGYRWAVRGEQAPRLNAGVSSRCGDKLRSWMRGPVTRRGPVPLKFCKVLLGNVLRSRLGEKVLTPRGGMIRIGISPDKPYRS